MSILPQIDEIIQSKIWPRIGLKLWPMFSFGINALSLNPFCSLNGNARILKGKSGMMQMYRLVQKDWSIIFAGLLVKLFKITDNSFINIDFTMFDPFAVLCLALQTKSGRAIPVWIETLKYPIKKDSQNIFILESLEKFVKVVGCNFKIMADRGFIGEYLINGFRDLGLTFYVRMKAGKSVVMELKNKHQVVSLRAVNWLDFEAIIYGHKLRVIRSSKTLQRKLNLPECWYIITNDFETSRETILNTYYHRFEIEEAFKDIKHIFKTRSIFIEKTETLTSILWFQIMGIWLLWLTSVVPKIGEIIKIEAKKQLSWIRLGWEHLWQERLKPIVYSPSYQLIFKSGQLYQV